MLTTSLTICLSVSGYLSTNIINIDYYSSTTATTTTTAVAAESPDSKLISYQAPQHGSAAGYLWSHPLLQLGPE